MASRNSEELSVKVQSISETEQKENTMALKFANTVHPADKEEAKQEDSLFTADLGIDPETEFYICKQGFSLIKKIGEGHFGKVFEAWTEQGETVALKLLDKRGQPEVEQYWRKQEALMAVKMVNGLLRHPNLMCPLAVFGTKEVFCIVNEYAERSDLHKELGYFGPMEEDRLQCIAKQLLSALQYLHNKNIIHRDVKPANVLRMEEGIIQLTDFGLAEEHKGTCIDKCPGTMAFQAPELLSSRDGSALFNHKADLWAYGVTLYGLATCQLPFLGRTPQEILTAQKTTPVHYPPSMSLELRSLLEALFRVDFEERPDYSELWQHPFLAGSLELVEPLDEMDSDEGEEESSPLTALQQQLNQGMDALPSSSAFDRAVEATLPTQHPPAPVQSPPPGFPVPCRPVAHRRPDPGLGPIALQQPMQEPTATARQPQPAALTVTVREPAINSPVTPAVKSSPAPDALESSTPIGLAGIDTIIVDVSNMQPTYLEQLPSEPEGSKGGLVCTGPATLPENKQFYVSDRVFRTSTAVSTMCCEPALPTPPTTTASCPAGDDESQELSDSHDRPSPSSNPSGSSAITTSSARDGDDEADSAASSSGGNVSARLEDTTSGSQDSNIPQSGARSSARSDQDADEDLPGDQPVPIAAPAAETVDTLLAVCRAVADLRVQQAAMQETIVMLQNKIRQQQEALAAQQDRAEERAKGKLKHAAGKLAYFCWRGVRKSVGAIWPLCKLQKHL